MTTATARWLAGGLLLLTVAALAVSAGFGVAAGNLMDAFAFAPLLLAFAVVGAIVASHLPANPIGWLFLAEGLGFALGVATDTYATYATRAGAAAPPSVAWAVWLGAILGELGFLFALAVLLFPDGRLPSPRWRVVAWLIIAGEALVVLMAATSSAALRAQAAAVLVSPVRLIPDSLADPVVNVMQTAFIPLSLAAAAGLAVRYRRASPDVRHQIKWVAYASLLTAVALLITGIVFGNPLGALLAVGPLIPVAAGIAIFKYRFYDIDVVISKTIVYGSLAAFITVVYVVIVAGIGSLGSGFVPAGSRPDLGLSIVATAVVAVAFQPVRERAQRLANRLVFGKRATPYEALSEFAGRIGGSYAADDVLPRMAQILAEGTGASRAVVWLKDGEGLVAGASWPPEAGPPQRAALGGGEPPVMAGADRVALVHLPRRDARGAVGLEAAGENPSPRSRASSCPTWRPRPAWSCTTSASPSSSAPGWPSCRPRGCGSSPRKTSSGGGSSATSTMAPSSSCWPSSPRWPRRSRWPAGTRSGNGRWSRSSRPRPAARWRHCANSRAAFTRRCSPARACLPRSAARPARRPGSSR